MTGETVRRYLRTTAWQSNLVGALITYAYFRFIDYEPPQGNRPLTAGEIAYFVVGFAGLIASGAWLAARWNRPLQTVPPPPGPAGDVARRRALQQPYVVAGITFVGWALAGVIWGVGWQLIAGTFSPADSVRSMFGITVISGTVATTLAFLIGERRWRQALPAYFPEGRLTAVEGAPRLGVRARLLVVLLVVAVIPISVLGMASYQTAKALLAAGAGAAGVVTHMLVVVVFLVLASMLASIGLALSVSRSVAEPLGRLRAAMAEVERGRLDTRCPVVSNDEIGELTEGFNGMVQGLQEREVLRETFGKYVSEEIRDEILAGRVTLEGQLREVTILFADIRDFTPWVEATDPRDVVRDLNAYFTEMETAIRAHGGLVVQYIGDEIEAVFGAPVTRPGHAGQAVRAALEMRARLADWNAARARTGRPLLRNGIGIHTGTVLAGNIGSADRLSYALVGDPVNLASRLQGLTKELHADVLVSGTTRARLDGEAPLVPLPAVKVKGRTAEVEVYALG
jgi:adenylate cyclase